MRSGWEGSLREGKDRTAARQKEATGAQLEAGGWRVWSMIWRPSGVRLDGLR